MNYRKAQMDEHLFKIHHKVKLQLDAICQEAGDMNVKEFMKVYEELESDIKQNYIGFWGIPNDYNTNGTLRMFDTKEEAIQNLITKIKGV